MTDIPVTKKGLEHTIQEAEGHGRDGVTMVNSGWIADVCKLALKQINEDKDVK